MSILLGILELIRTPINIYILSFIKQDEIYNFFKNALVWSIEGGGGPFNINVINRLFL